LDSARQRPLLQILPVRAVNQGSFVTKAVLFYSFAVTTSVFFNLSPQSSICLQPQYQDTNRLQLTPGFDDVMAVAASTESGAIASNKPPLVVDHIKVPCCFGLIAAEC